MIEEILTPVMYVIPSIYKQEQSQQYQESQQFQEEKVIYKNKHHPLYHTIIIDEKVIEKKRGIILLTHQITKEEFQSLYLNQSSDLNEKEMLDRCNATEDFNKEFENNHEESIKNENELLNDSRVHFISFDNLSDF